MNKCCSHLFREAKKELEIKDRRIALLESEITRVFEPTRKFWNESLEQKLADAVDVIKFYADRDNWSSTDFDDGIIEDSDIVYRGINGKGGKRAREFLAKLEEGKE